MPRKMARQPGSAAAETAPPAPVPARKTKIGQVIALLRRDQGATLAELVEAIGWLPHTTRAALTGLKKKGRDAQPGMRLVREWNGKVHVVTIGEDGVIRWNDQDWKSLSEVARAITGTRWSGPAFFGLKTRKAGAA